MKLKSTFGALLATGMLAMSSLALAQTQAQAPTQGVKSAAPTAKPSADKNDPKVAEEIAYLAGSLKAKYPTTNFSEINPTPLIGVYELITGKNIFYTDKEGAYLIMGNIYDMANSRDLTDERKKELNKLDFASLNPENAIVEVKGDGSRKLAILTDVDCPYCKRLEETLKNVQNVTIYRYLYPIDSLHPEARATSEAIWCLGDNDKRLAAFFNYMDRGMAPKAGEKCETPINEIQAFAKEHDLFGTPSMVNGKGGIMPGAVPQQRLEAFLNEGTDDSAQSQSVVVPANKKSN